MVFGKLRPECNGNQKSSVEYGARGWFKHVKGFIIGRPLCFGTDMMGNDQYNAVTGILSKYKVPIIKVSI